ncbi:MBL fold metallo-hydrolase [Candidatus Gottesmanbacteria bacterium]|nr:MBL fold metallo-hydrolase [Candidatus Gottesmanbacteria bacterium]
MNKLIFLGTGSANNLKRQMTSICFVTGKDAFLIDCGDGMGTLRQLVRANVPLSSVNTVFISHHHADHISGMPHFLFVQLLSDPSMKLSIYGPTQTLRITRSISFITHGYTKAHADRIAFHPMKSGETRELSSRARVTAVSVKGPVGHPMPIFAYAVSIGKKKVVFTSDMRPNDNFIRLAKGADILIHECFTTSRDEQFAHAAGHSTAKDAGLAAANTGAKQLILTHLRPSSVIGDGSGLVSEAKKYFSGSVQLAQDLMEILL